VLEPIAPPRVGQVFNFLAAILFAAAAVAQSTLSSVSGDVPFVLFTALVAVGFTARFAGCTYAIARDAWSMPIAARALSWLFFGGAVLLLARAGALLVVGGFAGFVVLDALAGLVKKDVAERPVKPKRSLWARVRVPLFVTLYLGLVVAVHFTVSVYLSYGTLVTWTLLALGFCILLRAMLVGPKAPETWLLPPADHRAHERRETTVADPQRARAEQALQLLRARGDAGPFLQFVRDVATEAELPPADLADLESRILSSFARAGTRRDEDITAALGEVERFLTLRKVTRT
jgi:hypothetical protein